MPLEDHYNKNREQPVKATTEIVENLLRDLLTIKDSKLEVINTKNRGLVAYFRVNGKTSYSIPLLVEVENSEQALPIPSEVESDDILGVVQQRYPQKNWGWNQEARPRMKTHLYGKEPKLRATKRRPFSDSTFNRQSTKRRRKSKSPIRKGEPIPMEVPWAKLTKPSK